VTIYSLQKRVGWEDFKAPDPPEMKGSFKFVDHKGYVRIILDSKNPKRYIYEHRYLIEQKIGRKLKAYESVHHINELKLDNRLENLFLTTNSEHSSLHREGKNTSLKYQKQMRQGARKAKTTKKRDRRGRWS